MSPVRPPRSPRARRQAVAGWLVGGLVGGCLGGLGLGAVAAPLDALLTALPERDAPRLRLEAAVDGLAGALRVRDEAQAATAPELSGNYRGAHLHAAWSPWPRLWLSGGVAERQISHGPDSFHYRSWQLAGQWRLTEPAGPWPALALRAGGWGNRAGETAATTPTTVPGAILDTVTVTSPGDRQLQADLIATWPLAPQLDVSALVSLGRNRLAYGRLDATTTRNGCPYQLAFNGNDIFGTLAGACPGGGGGVIRQFYDSSGDYGVDVAREIAWRGRFTQLGINARWQRGDWVWSGGLMQHRVKREAVDDILRARGLPSHRQNRLVTLQAAWQAHPQWQPFARVQLSSHLFLHDIPVTYNTSTAGSFGTRSAVYSIGVMAGF